MLSMISDCNEMKHDSKKYVYDDGNDCLSGLAVPMANKEVGEEIQKRRMMINNG